MLVRMKTRGEIEGFMKAGRVAASILRQLASAAKDGEGKTTAQLDQLARRLCAASGASPAFLGYHGFPAAICASVGNELVHGIPDDRLLCDGDLLKIDIGVDIDGFIGDTAVTVRVGGPRPDELDRLIFDCRIALLRGIAAARPGGDLGDIGEEISREAKRGGWKIAAQYGGHGMDRGKLHADPFVDNARTQSMRLRPGMVLAIEPMFVAGPDVDTAVAANGWTVRASGPAAHFEHSIVVSELGEPRVLTGREEE